MTKSKLLIALTAGLFATGAFAQTSSGNSSGSTDTTAAPMQDSASAPMGKKAKRSHSSKMSSAGASASKKKTPDVTTGASAATMNGQGN